MKMKTYIELKKIKFYAFHGVMTQEQKVGNIFEVSLRIAFPFEKALESDDLNDTISYADLYELVKAEMMVPSKLLEHLAGRIIRSIHKSYPEIKSGFIKITKCTPPIPGEMEGASIEIEW